MENTIQDRFIRLPEVCKIVGVAKSTIWLWVKQGKFPKPVKLGQRVIAWRASDILKWINEL